MGHEIVYCGGCGKSLREEEFEKGRARFIDDIPFCVVCRPAKDVATPSSRALKPGSTPRVPLPRPATTRRVPATAERGSRAGLWAGGALGGAGLLVLVVFLASGGPAPERPPAAASTGDPAPSPPPVPVVSPPAAAEASADVWARLSAFATGNPDPDALLVKCDEAARALRGTPYEKPLRELEARAVEARKARDAERKLEITLAGARKLMASERRLERREEILGMLRSALPVAGPRRSEVQKLIDDFDRETKAPPPAVAVPGSAPFELDPTGLVRHWLILGPFPNDKEQEGLYRIFFEAEGVAGAGPGKEVVFRDQKRAWKAVETADGDLRLDSLLGPPPAVGYAAFWLESEADADFKFRVSADTGFLIWYDGRRIGNRSSGFPLAGAPETYTVKAVKGKLQFVCLKVGSAGNAFALRVRVTTTASLADRAPGMRVWLAGARVIYRNGFESGAGRFREVKGGGSARISPDGVGGTPAALLPASGIELGDLFDRPVGESTAVRFKLKPMADVAALHVVSWSNETKANYWFTVRNLRKDAWSGVEFRMKEMLQGPRRDGPSLQGQRPVNVRIFFEGAPDGSAAVLDDFELTD